MRYIEFERISEVVESLCIKCGYELNDDVLTALEKAVQNESNAGALRILNQLLENARIAKQEMIPLCQDTGLAVVFVEHGCEVAVQSDGDKTLFDAINAGVAAGYENGYQADRCQQRRTAQIARLV